MAAVPSPRHATAAAIFAHYERKFGREPARSYLGASVLGRACARALWYDLRWSSPPRFTGRLYRLFQTGHLQESRIVDDLRAIGATVWDTDPQTGQQWTFVEPTLGGHLRGSCDGIATGLPESPKTAQILEIKTSNTKGFAKLQKEGVAAAKPEHWSQVQLYMKWSIDQFGPEAGCHRAMYIAVNKDSDDIHTERLEYDIAAAQALIDRARRIIFATTPPERISTDPDSFACKFCDHHAICHGEGVPAVSCRTCAHATAEPDGDARWSCSKVPHHTIPIYLQRRGCGHHRVIPVLLERFAEPVDSDGDSVTYALRDGGGQFVNGARPGFSSEEIAACGSKSMLADAQLLELRGEFAGEVVG